MILQKWGAHCHIDIHLNDPAMGEGGVRRRSRSPGGIVTLGDQIPGGGEATLEDQILGGGHTTESASNSNISANSNYYLKQLQSISNINKGVEGRVLMQKTACKNLISVPFEKNRGRTSATD